jgi:methyltransferase (TIGR00027 family)
VARGVSRTAEVVTLWRGIESARPARTRLLEDPLAPAFVGRRFRWALRLARLPGVGALMPWSLVDGHWAGPRGTVAVRTRYIDDRLADALRHGLAQVVILGAGFDSRAYRLPGLAQTRVFEVDHPATQGEKRRRLVRRLGALPPHVTLVPVDFTTDTLEAALAWAGYRADARTFFILEGVTHYLPAEAVDVLFRFVARHAAPDSQMVFTYIHRGALDGSTRFARAGQTLATVRGLGEPYTFGFDPAELPAYASARGLRLIEDVGPDTYRARYLTPLGRESQPLTEFQRAALVEVVGRD